MRKMGGLFDEDEDHGPDDAGRRAGHLRDAALQRLVQQGRDRRRSAAASRIDATRSTCLLFILPLVTAGITAFYMFRMWFMTFTGKPRDHHVYEHAHESPWVMTMPLILLGDPQRLRRLGLHAMGCLGKPAREADHDAEPRLGGVDCRPRSRSDLPDRELHARRDERWRKRSPSRTHELHERGRHSRLVVVLLGIVLRAGDLLLRRSRSGRGDAAVPWRAPVPDAQVVLRRVLQRRCSCGRRDVVALVPNVRPNRDRRLRATPGAKTCGRRRRRTGAIDRLFVDGLVNLVGERDPMRSALCSGRCRPAICAATCCSWCWRRWASSILWTASVRAWRPSESAGRAGQTVSPRTQGGCRLRARLARKRTGIESIDC